MLGPALHITSRWFFIPLGSGLKEFARYLKPWHVVAFWTGFLFDLLGTWMMHRIAEKPFDITEPHTFTGQVALWVMLAHAIWATYAVRKGSESARKKFHRYSLIVWLIWLIPYIGGMYMGMSR